MCTAEDIRDDARINENHDRHVEQGENHWYTCPLCDDERDDSERGDHELWPGEAD